MFDVQTTNIALGAFMLLFSLPAFLEYLGINPPIQVKVLIVFPALGALAVLVLNLGDILIRGTL